MHQGRRVRPAWLDVATFPAASARDATRPLALPAYPAGAAGCAEAAALAVAERSSSNDPEDYFARHRWGFLTHSLLAGKTDWQQPLAE